MEALVGGETDMQALAELLVREANASGGGDNITAVCIRIDIGEEEV
jgi:serine/threonine protein phosphatase PrpC